MRLRVCIAALAVGISPAASAHFPILECQASGQEADAALACTASYSDGSLSGEVALKVFSYDDELLKTITTASDGTASFAMPEGEFYIVFDPGHEAPAEFDYAELE